MEFINISEEIRQSIRSFITTNWGSPIMVSRGTVHSIDQLPGIVVLDKTKSIVGLITYNIKNKECEIISLDSLIKNKGIGSELVSLVIDEAVKLKCNRIWLITSNDNTRAIRFYQKRGFNLKALHVNAISEARKFKPEIPEIGYDGIPISHELEFEKLL